MSYLDQIGCSATGTKALSPSPGKGRGSAFGSAAAASTKSGSFPTLTSELLLALRLASACSGVSRSGSTFSAATADEEGAADAEGSAGKRNLDVGALDALIAGSLG